MRIFDRFKKEKEPHYDSTNIRVNDLDVGFIFNYDLSTWEVQALYEYDWGDNYFTREFKISNGTETKFLNLEEDDELQLAITNKIKLRKISEDLHQQLTNNQKPPSSLSFNNRKFYLDKEASGYFCDITKDPENYIEFISWDFEDDSEEYILTIEQWGEKEFEASHGKYIEEFEISNILPAETK